MSETGDNKPNKDLEGYLLREFILISGIALTIIGVVLGIYLRISINKRSEKLADKYLSDYEDDEIIPQDVTKEFLIKGIKNVVFYLTITYFISLLGAVLIIVYILSGRSSIWQGFFA